jgi:hypothetical protein
MAQEINHQALYAEVRFLSRAIPSGICGRQNGNGRDFSRSASVFLSQYHSTSLPTLFSHLSPTVHKFSDWQRH